MDGERGRKRRSGKDGWIERARGVVSKSLGKQEKNQTNEKMNSSVSE